MHVAGLSPFRGRSDQLAALWQCERRRRNGEALAVLVYVADS